MSRTTDPPRPAWHALLAPLPPGVTPTRQPVVPSASDPSESPLAGWQQLVLHLSAGSAGLRTILVVLDAGGALLSASDLVLYRSPGNAPGSRTDSAALLQLSVGGRFEEDGSFHGTRWHSVAVERGGEEPQWESTPSEPSPDDVDALRSLVSELIRRQPRGIR